MLMAEGEEAISKVRESNLKGVGSDEGGKGLDL